MGCVMLHTRQKEIGLVCYFLRSNIARRDVRASVREREKTSRCRSYLPLVLPISIFYLVQSRIYLYISTHLYDRRRPRLFFFFFLSGILFYRPVLRLKNRRILPAALLMCVAGSGREIKDSTLLSWTPHQKSRKIKIKSKSVHFESPASHLCFFTASVNINRRRSSSSRRSHHFCAVW